jgi:AraC-like DNA-binding protein
MFRYPWGLLPRLGSGIELGQKDAAHRDVDEILEIFWKQSKRKLSLCKLRCAAMSSFCSRGALQGGASSTRVLKIQLDYLDKMTSVRSWAQARRLTHRFVDSILAEVRPERFTGMEQIVHRIREIMSQSISSPPSLAQHADAFGVSPGHLSRCFAATTGRTFQQATRQIRMDKAKQMLVETNLKVTTVAKEVGFADASRFILEFRKELGITPGRYRKTHGKKSGD